MPVGGHASAMDYQSLSINLMNYHRRLEDTRQQLVGQITTGNRLVTGKIDPSGLAITKGMDAQIRGMSVSVQNAQETFRLLNLADSAMDGVTDKLLRMRDLAIRMANEATSNTKDSGNPAVMISSDQRSMYDEMGKLAEEIRRVCGGLPLATPPFIVNQSAVNFNGKDLFFADFDTGQNAQIGPNNNSADKFNIVIPSMTDIADSVPVPAVPMPGTFTAADFRDFALQQLDELSADIEKVSTFRNAVGSQSAAILKIVTDINQQSVDISGAKSRIDSTDMGAAISDLKRNLVTQSTLSAAMLEFNDMQASRLQFLNVLPVMMDKGK
jgi:flagellin